MVLTQEWQNVASYQVSHDTGFRCTFYLDAKYSGQSTANLTTTFQTRLRSVVTNGSGAGAPYKFTLSYANDIQGSSLWTYATETIMEGQGIERHNEDGTKSITLSATMYVSASLDKYKLNASMSATVDLPTIDRYPILIDATDFTDEGNPTITYTTNVGFQNATTYAGISLNGTTDTISYRQVTIRDGTYTFSLDTNERNALRNATPNSNYLDVYFILKTVVGNDTYYSTPIKRQMTIVNGSPTFEHSEQETVQKVINVLGSSSASSVIQNVSVMRITIVPTALKGSTISAVRVSSGSYSETKTAGPYVYDVPVTRISFGIVVTDSRGNNTPYILVKTLINYTPVSFTLSNLSFERDTPTSSDIILNFEGNYLQTTFGSTANVPTIKWKLDNGSYTTIPSTNYVIDTTNNKIKLVDYQLTDVLYYKNPGTFSLELSDLLTTASNSQDVLAGIPTFDYGEHDLKVNGDLFVADEDGENKVNILSSLNSVLPIVSYSDTEQVVGRWINGKPLYRQVFDISNISSTNQNLQDLQSLSIATVINIRGYIKDSSYYVYPVPMNDSSSNYSVLFYSNGYLRGRCEIGTGGTVLEAKAIIEYTKTID